MREGKSSNCNSHSLNERFCLRSKETYRAKHLLLVAGVVGRIGHVAHAARVLNHRVVILARLVVLILGTQKQKLLFIINYTARGLNEKKRLGRGTY